MSDSYYATVMPFALCVTLNVFPRLCGMFRPHVLTTKFPLRYSYGNRCSFEYMHVLRHLRAGSQPIQYLQLLPRVTYPKLPGNEP